MAQYRFITKHVRYWRGVIHRWSCSYEFTGSGTTPDAGACSNLLVAENKLLYPGITGTVPGGTYECVVYGSGGGTPIATYTAFDVDTPADWIAPTGTAWPTHTAALDSVAETALVVEWAGGLSKSGKPVQFKKWFHMVPASTATPGTQDIPSATVTSLTTAANALAAALVPTYGLLLGNSSRLAGSALVQPYYGNHQMPRGRRRKPLVSSDGTYNGPTIKASPPQYTIPITEIPD